MGKNIPDKIGKRYENLVVKKYLGNLIYECQCDCGNIIQVHTSSLRNDKKGKKRCDECTKKLRKENLKGQKVGKIYGKLRVIKFLGNKNYLCECKCGNLCIVKTTELREDKRRGKFNCGCEVIHYNKNEDYFNAIDSEEKAYILGFIASDGHVNETHGNIKITLKSSDIDILEKIKKSLEYNGPIRIKKVETKLPQGNKCKSEVAELIICSRKLVNQVVNLGLTERKTYDMIFNFDNIPNNLIRHFLRGYWDGDGSSNITRSYNEKLGKHKTNYAASCIGNIGTMKEIKKQIIKFIPDIHIYDSYKNSTLTIRINKKKDFQNFINFLYKNSSIYLDRKYKLYKENIVILDLMEKCKENNYYDIPVENKEKLYTEEKYKQYEDFLNS